MKRGVTFLILLLSFAAYGADQKPAPTLKSILLEQLRTTHNQKDWFVTANISACFPSGCGHYRGRKTAVKRKKRCFRRMRECRFWTMFAVARSNANWA